MREGKKSLEILKLLISQVYNVGYGHTNHCCVIKSSQQQPLHDRIFSFATGLSGSQACIYVFLSFI